jgi:uncharacterized protein YjdB
MATPIKGTQALAAAVRVEENSTQEMEAARNADPTPKSAPTVSVPQLAAAIPGAGSTVPTAGTLQRKRRVPMIAAGIGTIVVALIVVLSKGGGSAAPDPVPIDSTAIRAALAAAIAESLRIQDSLLDIPDTNVVSVRVTPPRLDLTVGDSLKLNAFGVSKTGETVRRPVRWSSSDTTLVVVSATGWVKGIARTPITSPVFVYAATAGMSSASYVTVK